MAYSQKISDSPLTSISQNQNMVAIGDAEGTVSIMQLCKALYEPAPREKDEMNKIFDREFRREKTLDVAKRMAAEALIKNKKVKNEKLPDPEEIAQ